MLKVGDIAPDFSLKDQNDQTVHLKDLTAKGPVVVFFYPKDQTPGCTTQACSFRDNYQEFRKLGAEIVGISDDSSESHEQFAKRNHLPFQLLYDQGGHVRKQYGVRSILGLLKERVTFVIDASGRIKHVIVANFLVKSHVRDALDAVRACSIEG